MPHPLDRSIVALALAASLLGAGGAEAMQEKACSRTSRAAQRACENEVRDDTWIAIGICTNASDPLERKPCRRKARQEGRDATPECAEQREARDELCEALGEDAYAPEIDPARFLSPEDTAADPNPYFPLVPGTIRTYEAESETIVVTVTDETKEILGVECIVVHDVVEEDGEPVEDTRDYFAQDVDGTVWYFGEIALNYEDGELVDVEGSWTAGKDGAKPGVVMPAAPVVGETYRQEWALGDAEDAATVVSVTASAMVPAAECDGTCVQTLDFTPIEPDAREHKFHAPGIGAILEVDLETGERVELVEVTTP